MHEVAEGKLDAITRPTVFSSRIDELEVPELEDVDNGPPENHQDNGAMPPFNIQPFTPHSHPEDTSVVSAALPPCPRVEADKDTLQVQEGVLPDVRLFGSDHILYSFYQFWVHQNPGDHFGGGIAEDSKWQAKWKNHLYAGPTLCRTFRESQEEICGNLVCRTRRGSS